MAKKSMTFPAAITLLFASLSASAHFQTLIPDNDIMTDVSRPLSLSLRFTHPMEWGPVMEMGAPKQFGVLCDGKRSDLLSSLAPVKVEGRSAYVAKYARNAPGTCVFYVEPAPYWEKAERKYIIHYAKVVVDFMNCGDGWDALACLPVEIKPLARPFGLYQGNVFSGIVLKDGAPVPFATVEVEYYNEGRRAEAPTDMHVAQVVKADASGVFHYAMPHAGWWGFAALIDGPKTKGPDGKDAETELGALIWVKAYPWKETR